MTLKIATSTIAYRGPDRLDITRVSGREGLFLAPSWRILGPALKARREATALLEDTLGLDPTARATAESMMRDAWAAYVPAYLEEMRASYRRDPRPFRELLARERVVFCCYCSDGHHCHRRVASDLIFVPMGAVAAGEVR